MGSREELRKELEADLAWLVGIREHFLRDLAACDEGDWMLLQRADERIPELERAIRRLKGGEYGVCERCGLEIPRERLTALPECTLCFECAAGQERARQPRRRVTCAGASHRTGGPVPA